MKLRNKLILSCAALAAVATTAVSTTFAWYTSNDTVKASGITGKTSSQDATLLLISTTGKQGSWGASVTIDSSNVTLEPVAYDAETNAYYPWSPSDNEVSDTAATGGLAANNAYISFYLYFKSGSAKSLNVNNAKFNLRNTTGTTAESTTPVLPTFTVLAPGTGSATASYSVDMLNATNIVLTVDNGQEALMSATANPTVGNSAVRTAYAADSAASAGLNSGANAHTYYNNVKSLTAGVDAIDDTIETSETGDTYDDVSTIQDTTDVFCYGQTGAGATGGQDNMLMVRFDIYLDGWDIACFDACRKQTFALDMEFSATDAA